jgi:hypothetical protein
MAFSRVVVRPCHCRSGTREILETAGLKWLGSGGTLVSYLRDPLLYFASFGAVLVLFVSTFATLLWLLDKLRQGAIRFLGGRLRDDEAAN